MFKIKNITAVGLVILSVLIGGCAKKVVTNKTVEEHGRKKFMAAAQINVTEKTYESLFKEEEPVKSNLVEEEIVVEIINEPIVEVVPEQIVKSCDEIGLVSQDMCEFCASIDGAECRAIETISDGQDCYSCVEILEVTEALEGESIKAMPEELAFESNLEKDIVVYKEIEEESISDLEKEVDKMLDEVMEMSDNYKMINEKVVKVEELEEFEEVQEVQEVEKVEVAEEIEVVDEIVSVEQDECTVFDLLNFSDCTECDGNCVVEDLPDFEGTCYRCESSSGGARCSDIGLKTDCSKCEDSSTCEFMELTVYLADGEKFEQSCYNCG